MTAGTTTYRPSASKPGTDEVLDALQRAGFVTEPPTASTIAVLDTFDGRIAEAGLRLELVDGRQLMLSGKDSVPAGITVSGQPRVADDLPPGPLRHRLTRLLDVRALLRLVEITSQRTAGTKRNGDGKVTAAVTVHDVPTVDGVVLDRVVVEAIELTGYPKSAGELRDLLDGLGLRAVDGGSGRARRGQRWCPAGRLRRVDRRPADVRRPGDRRLSGRARQPPRRDARQLGRDGRRHRSRVPPRPACRRAPDAGRAGERQPRCSPTTSVSGPATTSRWLGAISGAARDLDVYQIEWPDYTATLDADGDEGPRPAARAPRRATRRRPRRAGRPALVGAGDVPPSRRGTTGSTRRSTPSALGERSLEPLDKTVGRRIRRAHRVMVERGRTITPATPAETVHELRKDAKKLRYLIECFGGLYDKPARTAFVGRLKALQDTLGEHQDAEVHAHALRTIADDRQRHWDAETLLAIGQLIERLEQRRRGHAGTSSPSASPTSTSKETAKALKDAAGERQGRVRENARHVQHQGRRGQDDHGRQPQPSRRRRPGPGCCCGTSIRRARRRSSSASSRGSRVASRRLLGGDGELAANVKESDVAGLHLVPADFSLRHLDVHLADGDRLDGAASPTLLEPLADDYDVGDPRLRPRHHAGQRGGVPRRRRAARADGADDRCRCARSTSSPRFLADDDDGAARSCRSCRCSTGARRCTAQLIESLADVEPPFLATAIPNASAVERMAVHRAPLGEVAPRSRARHGLRRPVGRGRRPPLAP